MSQQKKNALLGNGWPRNNVKVVFSTGSDLDTRTPVRDLHLLFKIPCVYDYITKLRRRQAEIIQNHPNPNARTIGQGETIHRKYKRLKLGGGQAYHRSSD
jgi:hypothetical protein